LSLFPYTSRIVLTVYDHDTFGKNDVIGATSWTIDEIRLSSVDGIYRKLDSNRFILKPFGKIPIKNVTLIVYCLIFFCFPIEFGISSAVSGGSYNN
jgi:hypothetical protein